MHALAPRIISDLTRKPSLGHTFIDVLKVDIEGGEFDALTAFIDAHADRGQLPIGQLQLEIHARDGRERFDYFNHWWMTLEAAGLRPFWMEPNLVYINLVHGALPELSEVRSRSDSYDHNNGHLPFFLPPL